MDFRSRLLATLRRLAPLFEEEGVMVVGSEVPNLLQPAVAATLVVSQDVAIGVPVDRHAALKERLAGLEGLRPAPEEPSVVPDRLSLLEPRAAMPDPRPHRQLVVALLDRIERWEEAPP